MRVAIVHDWLYTVGGAERVLQAILRCFPSAELFSLFDLLDPDERELIGYRQCTTSFLQNMPFVARNHRIFLPLMPLAIEQLDLAGFDLVISSSYAVAKGVLTGPDQLHVSYVHSPMRYAWDMQGQYLKESGLHKGIASWATRAMLHRMRLWDVRTAAGVDHYVANSRFVARRIRKVYGRGARIVHPPVRVPIAPPAIVKERFFLTASRLVPYKNVRVLIDAFRHLPHETLLVAGDGPEFSRLKASAGPNVRLLGYLDDTELADLMGRAQAFLFAAEEDFGIVPVEAQALGTPVIALGRGGVRETVITEGPGRTGMFFDSADPATVAAAVERFIDRREEFSPLDCYANALRFSEARFHDEFRAFVEDAFDQFDTERRWRLTAALPLGAAPRADECIP